LVNSKNPRQSAGHEFFSGTLAHLYSGAIHLKFPLGRLFKTGRMESQANFLGALNPTLEKIVKKWRKFGNVNRDEKARLQAAMLNFPSYTPSH
jgi:hypothetical protein